VLTGGIPVTTAFNSTLQNDLQRAEYVALPVTLLLLILIFAAVVAALLPLGVGLLAIVGGLGGTLFLAHFTDVSQYASNVVTLIGLGVAIDYSLFIVNRFRDELAAGHTREDAIAISMSRRPPRTSLVCGREMPTAASSSSPRAPSRWMRTPRG
jgi:RND superfamily putative drug exporter